MLYNYYFDICALCILGTIAMTILSRRWVPAYRQRAYALLFFAVFISALSERYDSFLQMNPVDAFWYHPLEMTMCSIYFVSHLSSGFFFLIYIFSVLDIYIDLKTIGDFMTVAFPLVMGAALVVVNFFYPVLFYYDDAGIYHRADMIVIFYFLAVYYIIFGLTSIQKNRNVMRKGTKAVIYTFVALVIAGLVIQFCLPTVLIENFFITISIALVYITLQNPSEMVDENLNILNRRAFLEGQDLKTFKENEHTTVFISIENIRALSEEIGYTKAQGVLKRIAKYLKNVGQYEFGLQCYTYRYSEFVFAITVHSDNRKRINDLLHAIADRLTKPWISSNMAIKVEGHVFSLRCPDDYNSTTALMNKLDIILNSISFDTETIIDLDSLNINEIRRELDYDMMARKNLDSKTCIIKFQPILSKIYKINYNADVFCFLLDEYGNEIDMRGHIPDASFTQSLMDTDEFVYRRACRALAFWNGGDKNGKYRLVVGMSQGEISRNDFIRRIKKILREERAEASWITIKLTETCIATMNSTAERNLHLLADMNCSIIVDKFGNGYGDITKILELPVIQINLDHGVLLKAIESPGMKLVTQGIINLFHDISLFVGATDIETQEEKEMAEQLGCDYLMGDFLGRPMKDSSFVRFIDKYYD